MKLKSLTLKDQDKIARYLKYFRHELAVYSFADIFIWKNLFDISWAVIDGNLCVFFKDGFGTFLYLPPMGKCFSAQAVTLAYGLADKMNANPEVARIENIEEKDLGFFRNLGLRCRLKSRDYVVLRADMAQLRGAGFKSQRWARNYFLRNYNFSLASLRPADKPECLKLYRLWMSSRRTANPDRIYQGLMGDSLRALDAALAHYSRLGFKGICVRIDGRMRGFTFGYELNADTFCILYEITDLSVKGLAQYIFSENCRGLGRYKYINVMDDSGLDNLKKVKLAYRPVKLVSAYIARRNE
jgi:hypothetical protein